MDEMLAQIIDEAGDAVARNLSKAADALTTESAKQHNAEKKAISDSKIAVTQTATQLLTDKMKEIDISEEYAKNAIFSELETIVNKRSRLDKIWDKTKSLLRITPKDDTNPNNDIGEISDDWLNRFRDVACLKSSEDAQEYFSKVLAGEIQNPGSFSSKALTTLADMDENVAQLFQTFCSLCLIDLDNPKMYLTQSKNHFKIKDARVPIIKDHLYDLPPVGRPYSDFLLKCIEDSKTIYSNHGLTFEQFKLLVEYELIIDHTSKEYYTFWYDNDIWEFISPHASKPSPSEDQKYIRLTGYALTNVGKELFKIVEFDTPPQYWERISNFLKQFYEVNLYKYPKHVNKASSVQEMPPSDVSTAVSAAVPIPPNTEDT